MKKTFERWFGQWVLTPPIDANGHVSAAVNSRTNPLCHRTNLLVSQEVDRLQPFLASLSSLVVCLSSGRCARTSSASLSKFLNKLIG